MTVDVELIHGEDDVSYALRFADAIEAHGHEWGADVETACYVLAREVRRQRAELEAGRVENTMLSMALSEQSRDLNLLLSVTERALEAIKRRPFRNLRSVYRSIVARRRGPNWTGGSDVTR